MVTRERVRWWRTEWSRSEGAFDFDVEASNWTHPGGAPPAGA
jgi:hypothetical protein